jgi:hypothetical protein
MTISASTGKQASKRSGGPSNRKSEREQFPRARLSMREYHTMVGSSLGSFLALSHVGTDDWEFLHAVILAVKTTDRITGPVVVVYQRGKAWML